MVHVVINPLMIPGMHIYKRLKSCFSQTCFGPVCYIKCHDVLEILVVQWALNQPVEQYISLRESGDFSRGKQRKTNGCMNGIHDCNRNYM